MKNRVIGVIIGFVAGVFVNILVLLLFSFIAAGFDWLSSDSGTFGRLIYVFMSVIIMSISSGLGFEAGRWENGKSKI